MLNIKPTTLLNRFKDSCRVSVLRIKHHASLGFVTSPFNNHTNIQLMTSLIPYVRPEYACVKSDQRG